MGKRSYNFEIAGKRFTHGTHVMAILNLTPDSFYAPSRVRDDVVARAEACVRDGAEVIDIGGQSTRPGAAPVSIIDEMARVVPAVSAIKRALKDVLLSVDTFYPEVAEACIAEGADMINDVSGLSYDGMAETIARGDVAVCVMHNRRHSEVGELMLDKLIGLQAAIGKLLAAGVRPEHIMLDGGIGFNKSRAEDIELLGNYGRLMGMFEEYPFLLGTSRKSLFGGEAEGRLSATLDSTAEAARNGVLFVRVHDVKENAAVIRSIE